jgi:hypothetical protein
MPRYEIKRWDSVIPQNNTFSMPMIYIKPDKDFIEYAKMNQWTVMVEIEGSNSIYDGKKMVGVIDSSGYFPNYRPNYYNKTGEFVVTLFAQWYEYPPQRGYAIVRGAEGPDKIIPEPPKPYEAPAPMKSLEMYTPEDTKGMNNSQLTWFLVSFLLIFCVLLGTSLKDRKIE